MRIFISHSSKDSEIAIILSDFLSSISSNVSVFCTSISGHISVGQDFVETINKNLTGCDAFIPLLSDNYYKSRYCMIELGFAYSFLSGHHDIRDNYMFPIAIPPIKKDEALSSTPLARIQVCSINTRDDIKSLVDAICESKGIRADKGINQKIHSFIYDVNKEIFKNFNILQSAKVMMCKSGNVVGEDGDYLNFSRLEMGAGYAINFRAKPFSNISIYPDFLSVVFGFVDMMNLYDMVNIFNVTKLKVNIMNYTNSISKIVIEIKFGRNHNILERREYIIGDGDNHIVIPIIDFRSEALKEVSEICFVIMPSAYIEDEGMFKIMNMEITPE